MALFRRRGSEEPLAVLSQRAFAERGIETTIAGPADRPTETRLLGADGSVYPLANLAAITQGLSPRQRLAVVAEHADRMVRAESEPPPQALSGDELRDRIRLRLVSAQAQRVTDISYGRPFAPEILQVLAVDNPSTVTTLGAGVLEQMQLDIEEMFALGQANTDREPIDERREVAPGVQFVGGSSLFIASKAVNLPAVFGSAPYGTVIALPHRHMLLTAPVRDATSIDAITFLAKTLLHVLADGREGFPGGLLSPYLYFVRHGEASRVSAFGDDGAMQLQLDDRLLAALEQASTDPV